MKTSELPLERPPIAQLRRRMTGQVIAPGDAEYDAARAVYFTAIDRRPAAIARAADRADVQRVIELARESGMELSVRGGGHSPAGHGLCDGIVLDLSALRSLEIDAAARIARAGGGLTTGEYTVAAGAHGLATGFGDAPTVGVGGITLAGGIGFLHRKHGLTIDNLRAAELVTADGQVVRADAESHPDLFWAIRGGGGNFGVATRLEYRLQPVATVLGGMLMLPATAERIVAFVDAALAAPDELSMIINIALAPPMPFIPPEQQGKPVIMALLVYAGGIEAGEAALAPFRALAPALVDMVRPIAYPEMFHGEAGAPHPAAVSIYPRFIDALDVAAAERILERLQVSTAPMRVVQLRPLGGAVARVATDATAFAHRERRMLVNVAAMHAGGAEAAEHAAWAAETAAGLGEGTHGAYVAFLGSDGAARIGDAYPRATRERLAAVKSRYDPTNLFHHNHNIATGR